MINKKKILGSGLIRIGRVWGVKNKPMPSEKEVRAFLEKAFSLGIRFYDTAPAYGLSEQRLGYFVSSLSDEEKKEITIATKFGEHWKEDTYSTKVDHSYEALVSSLEQSYKRLHKIDLLQLHKSSQETIKSDEVQKAFDYSKSLGINDFGASVSDLETGLLAIKDTRFKYIQLPYNSDRTELLPVILGANKASKQILFNRPFAMGAVTQKKEKKQAILRAYNLILKTNTSGVILTGTATIDHLQENVTLWNEAYEKNI